VQEREATVHSTATDKFSDSRLFVVLRGKYFAISLQRDDTWNEMIEYGLKIANVESHYLETVPLHV